MKIDMSQNVSINVSYSKFKLLTKFYILNNEIHMVRLNVWYTWCYLLLYSAIVISNDFSEAILMGELVF